MTKETTLGLEMVYLFNSAIRGTYKENIFRILALPRGCSATLRYTVGQNAKQEAVTHLKKDKEVTIVFIDRYRTGSYQYVPIRKARIRKAFEESGQLYVECVLDQFCAAIDKDKFTTDLQKHFSDAPKLTNNKPDEANDGQYALVGKSLSAHLKYDHKVWRENADCISATNVMPQDQVAFIRIRMLKEDRATEVQCSDNLVINPLKRNYLEVLYMDPAAGKKDKFLELECHDPIIVHQSSKRKLGTVSDILMIPMMSKYRLDQRRTFITATLRASDTVVYSIDIPVAISAVWLAVLFAVGALLIVAADVVPDFYKSLTWLAVTCSIIKWILVLFLMGALGKMPGLSD